MKHSFLLILFCAFFIQCKKADSQPAKPAVTTDSTKVVSSNTTTEGDFKTVGDSVEIPKFRLEVNLSDDAVKKLNDHKESFIVSYYFYGTPKESTLLSPEVKKHLDLYGLKLLGKDQEIKTVKQSNEIDFSGLKIPKNLYDALQDKNISLNINIFSGRRVFKDNILDMEAYDGPFNDIVKHSGFINLNGRLLPKIK